MKKNIFAFLLAIVMLMSSFTVLAGAASNLMGDIDGDSKVEASDARFILRASVGLENISSDQFVFADMDKDGKITAADARFALRTSVGLEKQQTVNGTGADTGTSEFSEITVMDNNEALVKVTELDPDDEWGYAFKVSVKNKTTDKTLGVTSYDGEIEGLVCYPWGNIIAEPGQTAEEYFFFDKYEIDAYNITSFTDLTVTFWLVEHIGKDDYRDIAKETVHIYPEGKDKAVRYTRVPQKNDKVLVDNEYIKVIAYGTSKDDYFNYVDMFIVNKSGKEVFVSAEDTFINGKEMFGSMVVILGVGSCSYASLMLDNMEMSENGFSSITSADFRLLVEDFDSLEDYVDQKITYKP